MDNDDSPGSSDSADRIKRKKGVRNQDMYYRNMRKRARIEGKSYTNSVDTVVSARVTGDDYKCRRKCFELFDDDSKMNILHTFSTFKTKNEQDIALYVQGLLTIESIKQNRPSKDEPNARPNNFGYYIKVGSDRKRVCKRGFISLYGITEKRIRRIASLLQAGAIPDDERS